MTARARAPGSLKSGKLKVEDTAFEDAQPASRQLETHSGHDGGVSAVSCAKTSAFRLSGLRHVQRPSSDRAEGRAYGVSDLAQLGRQRR